MYPRIQLIAFASALVLSSLGFAQADNFLSSALSTVAGPLATQSNGPSASYSGSPNSGPQSMGHESDRYDSKGLKMKKVGKLFIKEKCPPKHPEGGSPELTLAGGGSYAPVCGWIYNEKLRRTISTCCDPRLLDCPWQF